MSDLFDNERLPIDLQIQCVQREISLRERVYPRFVERRTMTQERADYELKAMRDVLATLKSIKGGNDA